MKKFLIWLLLGTIVSFYLFPFSFRFLPTSLNTKMMLAVVGAMLVTYDCVLKRTIGVSRLFLTSVLLSLTFSLACYLSCVVNNTSDYTYATYFSSYFTWLGGAYAVCYAIRLFHDEIDIATLTAYMAGVCVFQGVIAQVIDHNPGFDMFLDRFIEQSQAFLRQKHRLYGIGASLDNAGVRFTVTLVMIAHQLCNNEDVKNDMATSTWYILAFFLITLLGNMIARTTSVGAILGLGYILLYRFAVIHTDLEVSQAKFMGVFLGIVAAGVAICSYLYNTDPDFHHSMRFAFEGFFNWIEQGEWRTDSTDKLNAVMWIWPTTTQGWIIGTGLFGGFIYSTDIGYCRFTLYCGLVGLSIFSLFFVYHAWFVTQKFRDTKFLALLLLACTFIIWIKVATDIFFIYALFICMASLRTKRCEDDPDYDPDEIDEEDEEVKELEEEPA